MSRQFVGAVSPTFGTLGAPYCGFDCECLLSHFKGREYSYENSRFPTPTFPSTACARLAKIGVRSEQFLVPVADRRLFLEQKLQEGIPILIWVRGEKWHPSYNHIVAVLAYGDSFSGDRMYYVMDSRKGISSSRDADLRTGNRVYTESELFALWRNFFWSKTVPALFPL